jgi:ferredoxin-NADP reductase
MNSTSNAERVSTVDGARRWRSQRSGRTIALRSAYLVGSIRQIALYEVPEASAAGNRFTMSSSEAIDVRLTGIRFAAEGINLYELQKVDGTPLPPVTAGSHIDIHLPAGMVRQYSLAIIDPASRKYIIGVKRDPHSRDGSRYMHEMLRVGTILKISCPRNNFSISDSTGRHVFIAGGIGITPILAMVQHLHETGRSWELHYACRTRAQAAFARELGELGSFKLHLDDESGGVLSLDAIVAATEADAHIYLCGPDPMLRAFKMAVSDRDPQWVHIELFTNPDLAEARAGGYVVELARSKKTFLIPAGETILEVLRAAGIAVSSSCEQGICGSCETVILSGIPDHRDAVLSNHERALGRTMMICCSGSKGDKLVLDL